VIFSEASLRSGKFYSDDGCLWCSTRAESARVVRGDPEYREGSCRPETSSTTQRQNGPTSAHLVWQTFVSWWVTFVPNYHSPARATVSNTASPGGDIIDPAVFRRQPASLLTRYLTGDDSIAEARRHPPSPHRNRCLRWGVARWSSYINAHIHGHRISRGQRIRFKRHKRRMKRNSSYADVHIATPK
jgi:hypothetical protein